ncbi:MAG TPA: ribosome silencing factor [Desulfomonilaceae bacterium]|nr:ribosome silencing factor [Desulfomonilaceae bacterium]
MKKDADKEPAMSAREKADILLRAALTKKASDPVLIRLGELSSLTDFFLIVSARSGRQVKAIAEAIIEESRGRGFKPFSVEGLGQGHWALLDYGDVIVHVFFGPTREFYDLEGLWAEAPRERLPEEILQELQAAKGTYDEEEW